jgi:tetratricopeptide (TPR) repeat protein
MEQRRIRLTRPARAAAIALLAALCACGSPKPPPGPEQLAETYLAAKRYPEALRESEKLVRLQPRNIEYRLLAARANEGMGDTQRALSHLEMAQEIAPSDAEPNILIGELEQRLQNPDDAYVAFRRATMLAPDDQRAWRGLALTAEALGFQSEAERAYARWAELEKMQGEKE